MKIQLLLYIVIQKTEILWNERKNKNKEKRTFKDFASIYNVDKLNSFNPELQLKNTESAIKNKLQKIIV